MRRPVTGSRRDRRYGRRNADHRRVSALSLRYQDLEEIVPIPSNALVSGCDPPLMLTLTPPQMPRHRAQHTAGLCPLLCANLACVLSKGHRKEPMP